MARETMTFQEWADWRMYNAIEFGIENSRIMDCWVCGKPLGQGDKYNGRYFENNCGEI